MKLTKSYLKKIITEVLSDGGDQKPATSYLVIIDNPNDYNKRTESYGTLESALERINGILDTEGRADVGKNKAGWEEMENPKSPYSYTWRKKHIIAQNKIKMYTHTCIYNHHPEKLNNN